MSTRIRGRRRMAAIGLGAALVAAGLGAPFLASSASADTAGIPNTTRATTPTQTNVNIDPANGPLTGLVSGNTININIHANGPTDTPAGPAGNLIFGAEARICAPGRIVTNVAEFQPSGGNCAVAALAPSTNFFVQAVADAAQRNVSLNFVVPTGGPQTLANGGGTLQCDSANPCDLWIRQQVATTDSGGNPIADGSGNLFQHYTLNFAGAPSITTGVVATPGSGQVGLAWTAPASTGGAAIDRYDILVTDVTAGTPATIVQSPGAGTTFTVPGLTNFHQYAFTVTAHNASGFTGPASTPTATATPGPTPPSNVSGSSGDHQVTLGWTPAATPGFTSHLVQPYTFDGTNWVATGAPINTGSAVPTFVVTGLTNGTAYRFTVAAAYPGGNTPESAQSSSVTPNGAVVTQVITATRPQGTLDIAEACANPTLPGSPPVAAGPQFGVYPQTCTVNLGTAALDATATYYVADGAIQTVSVRDLRSVDAGWNVNGQLTSFVGLNPANTFAAGCLGLVPHTAELSNTALYTQQVTDGTTTVANCGAPGLGTNTVLAHAAPGGGLGRADLTGDLHLTIPVSAPADTYSATLTFTAI